MSIHQHTILENRSKAKKGHGWVKTTYRKLSFRLCECGNPVRVPQVKCPICKEEEERKREEAKKWKTCSKCGVKFKVDDDSLESGRICISCREKRKWRPAHFVLRMFFFPLNPIRFLPMEERIDVWAGLNRNLIQDISGSPEFKKSHIKFENVPGDAKTWDHPNSMKSSLIHYLTLCVENRKYRRYKYFKELLLQNYGVQFKCTDKQNRALAPIQAKRITPRKYMGIVGRVLDNETGDPKSLEESEKIIKPYFLYHDDK